MTPSQSGPDQGVDSRALAAKILAAVLDDGQPLAEALATSATQTAAQKLTDRDRAFARAIVMTALRRYGQIETALAAVADIKRLRRKSAYARLLLINGAAELLFLKVSAHAVVDCANRLARKNRHAQHFRPLINAVLRRLAHDGLPEEAKNEEARLNAPDWLWKRWRNEFGDAVANEIAVAHLLEPPLDLTPKSPSPGLAEEIGGEQLPTGSIRLTASKQIEKIQGYDEGLWWVQDAAAALPAQLFGNVRDKTVIDLCAAPGGKTAQLAALGANVMSVDQSSTRLARLESNMRRLDLRVAAVVANIEEWRPEQPAPCVLLDAPCAATGTLRRHPDIGLLKGPKDIQSLAEVQARLLDAAAPMVAQAGVLIYCTCSLEPEEGREQIESFLARNAAFARQPIQSTEIADQVEFISPGGDLRTLPSHWRDLGGLDGFYAARLVHR
jgi:16S rRNA (cytosine967-C5)-methyltransferase